MRIVLDTNQLVAALMRPPELATFLMAWESARFTVVASPEMLKEYQLVLKYPTIAPRIYPGLLRVFQSHLLHDIEVIEPVEVPSICRDPDDDKIIATAIYGVVDYLITIDQDLLTDEVTSLLEEFGIAVISADDLIQLLDYL